MHTIQWQEGRFSTLYRSGIKTYPIPFFGNIQQALVLTVGVNPSATEFVGRNWPASLDAEQLYLRLKNYFINSATPPHLWFHKWSVPLQHLGVSYAQGTVAHLDLSPRATASMETTNQRLFTDMVAEDIKWFFGLLSFCTNLRLILMAGCVGTRSMDRFVRRHAPGYGWEMQGQSDKRGAGRVGFYDLRSTERTLPVFFCSVSPSARNPTLLAQKLVEHSTSLQYAIAGLPRDLLILGTCAECGQLEEVEYYPRFDEVPVAPHRWLLCLKCLVPAIRAELISGSVN
jgi:hypothetical protein